jgi:hypothetical protein
LVVLSRYDIYNTEIIIDNKSKTRYIPSTPSSRIYSLCQRTATTILTVFSDAKTCTGQLLRQAPSVLKDVIPCPSNQLTCQDFEAHTDTYY